VEANATKQTMMRLNQKDKQKPKKGKPSFLSKRQPE
jgi:hypothetical protein